MEKRFYISTAIAYASAKPHIGNTYEIVLADAIARYKRLTGYDVYFQTGTDEHGQKIEEKAHAQNLEPQEYVDGVALEVRKIWDCMNTSYDKFVRTTNPNHKEVVSKIFKKLYDQGDIYLGVVGPVRVGKSTFIKRFMEKAVLPYVHDEYEKARMTDNIFIPSHKVKKSESFLPLS